MRDQKRDGMLQRCGFPRGQRRAGKAFALDQVYAAAPACIHADRLGETERADIPYHRSFRHAEFLRQLPHGPLFPQHQQSENSLSAFLCVPHSFLLSRA